MRIRIKNLVISLMALLALNGCGGGGGGGGTSSGASAPSTPVTTTTTATTGTPTPPATGQSTPAPTPTASARTTNVGGVFTIDNGDSPVIGTVYLDGAEAGAAIALVPLPASSESQVQVTLANGTVVYTDVAFSQADETVVSGSTAPTRRGLWVTPVSHLVASYRAATGASEVDSIKAVKKYLGIAPSESINRPYGNSYVSQFSPDVFMQAAAQAGLATFTRSLIADIRAGNTRPFRQVDPYSALRLVASPPATGGGAQKTTRGDLPTSIPFWAGVATNTVGDMFAAPVLKSISWLVGKFWIKSETDKELAEIQTQLNTIQQQLGVLGAALNALGTLQLASTITANSLAPLNTFTQVEALTATFTTGYIPFSPASTATLNAQGLINQLNQGNAIKYAQNIANACLSADNNGNVITGFYQAFGSTYGAGGAIQSDGSIAAPKYRTSAFFYDFRNDTLATPTMQNCADYYLTYLTEAANMLQETYDSYYGTLGGGTWPQPAPPADCGPPCTVAYQLAVGRTTLNGGKLGQQQTGGPTGNVVSVTNIPALLKRVGQQRPLALLGGQSAFPGGVWAAPGDPFNVNTGSAFTYKGTNGGWIFNPAPLSNGITAANGTMWAFSGMEYTDGSTVNTNILQSFGPNRTDGWWIPSASQVQQLCARASVAGNAAGYHGTQAIAYGLLTMGLLTQASYDYTAKNNNYDIKIFCNYLSNEGGCECDLDGVLQGYDTASNKTEGTYAYSSKGNLVIGLLCRPFPGAPTGANVYQPNEGGPNPPPPGTSNFGDGQTTGPSYITGSQTYRALQQAGENPVWMWQSNVALAGNDPPSEIVITQDTTDAHQLHAWALWAVTCEQHINASRSPINQYLMYTEVTDFVEWLSSDRCTADISNFPSTTQTIDNATVTGASVTPQITAPTGGVIGGGDVVIENPLINGTTITGGTLFNARTMSGQVSGTVAGTPFSATVSGASISSGTIQSGTVNGGTLYTMTSTNGQQTATLLTGATLSNATIASGTVIAANPGAHAGYLTVHNVSNPVTVTASWMYNANANPPANAVTSTWAFLTNPGSSSLPSITLQPGSTLPAFQPTLSYVAITPNNFNVALNGQGTISGGLCTQCQYANFFLTGFYSDGSVKDLTQCATWQSYLPTVSGQTVTIGPQTAATFGTPTASGVNLFFPPTFAYSGNMVVEATLPAGALGGCVSDPSGCNPLNPGAPTPAPIKVAALITVLASH